MKINLNSWNRSKHYHRWNQNKSNAAVLHFYANQKLFWFFECLNVRPFRRVQIISEWSPDENHSCDKIFEPKAVPICINAIVYKSDELNLTEYFIWFSLMFRYNLSLRFWFLDSQRPISDFGFQNLEPILRKEIGWNQQNYGNTETEASE